MGRPSLYPRIMGPAGRVVQRGRGEGKEGRREGRGGGSIPMTPEPPRTKEKQENLIFFSFFFLGSSVGNE